MEKISPDRGRRALPRCRGETVPAGWVRADWQAYLVSPDIEDDEEIVVYCPDCARREFGPFDAGV